VYQILSESPEFYRRYYKKHFGFFPGHSVLLARSADSAELKIIVTDTTEIFYWF